MQLKVSTDYAMRIVMYTAVKKEIVTSKAMSEELCIPQSLIFKICKKLANNGIIEITTGVQGGFSLQKRPEDISLFEIIDLFEPTVRLNRCLEDDEHCSCDATMYCPAHKFYCELQKKFENILKNTSIKDLLENKA